MPQFEFESVVPAAESGLHRGRSPEDAVRRAARADDTADVQVADDEDLHGWREVRIDGIPAGRLRLHQRMRFRRD